MNRVIRYTDTFGNVIRYAYDAAGNLTSMVYPDNTEVVYTYDANHNLLTVTDWANRITTYTYDENNKVVGVTKPDGSVITMVYDNAQRLISRVEHTSNGEVITGFEYTYDALGRMLTEKNLAKNLQICYTYDVLSRVVERASTNLADGTVTKQSYSYDDAGNILSNNDATYVYDTNNRLTAYNEQIIVYDADGNMSSAKLGGTSITLAYDSANRLVSTGECTYTYNAEDTRIRNISGDYNNIYVYNTNAKLSQLLVRITNGIVTKYVYGRGLIGEETEGVFKTYHFDYRGSTVAITDASGNITDTFAYDTYGRLSERTGDSTVIFGYNGRDGVVTDANGLIYMRARYYSPELHRFVNADIVKGNISNAVTLNRYAYANGNPVSNIDPLGLSAERGENSNWIGAAYHNKVSTTIEDEFDLTFGLDVLKVSYTQTITTSSTKGVSGEWFGVYTYKEVNTNVSEAEVDTSVGAGFDILYVLGFEVEAKWLGLGATLSLNGDDCSFYANVDIDLFGDSTAAIGAVSTLPNGDEISTQYSVEGNTALVLSAIATLVTGMQVDFSQSRTPAGLPAY